MAYTFSTGVIEYNTTLEVYQVQDVSIDVSMQEIPLQGNKQFPVAIASGPGSVKGTIKSGNFDTAFIADITNAVMAPNSSEVPIKWYIADTAGTKHTMLMPNTTITGLKFGGGSDKWVTSDITFEAAAAASGGAVVTKSTTANFPTLSPVTNHYKFGSGTLVYNSNTVGTVQDLSCDISYQSIPLMGNKQFPVAVAKGPGSVKITCKSGELDPLFFPSITNAVMAPNASELSLVWTLVDGSTTHTLTFPNVTFLGRKLSSGMDKWLSNDLQFSAAAKAADGVVLDVVAS